MDRHLKQEFARLEKVIQEQGETIVIYEAIIEGQGKSTEEIIRSAMDLRAEETEDLARYQNRIAELTTFLETVAASKSKFGTEARELLAIS